MELTYTLIERYKEDAKALGLTLQEYLLLKILQKLENEMPQRKKTGRGW